MSMVDDLLGTSEHVHKIISNAEEYVKAMYRVNEIIADMSLPNDQRQTARSLGMMLTQARRTKDSPMSQLGAILREFVQEGREQDHPQDTGSGSNCSGALAIGTKGYVVTDLDGDTLISPVRVIAVSGDEVCYSDNDGQVRWIDRANFFTDYETAAEAGRI